MYSGADIAAKYTLRDSTLGKLVEIRFWGSGRRS